MLTFASILKVKSREVAVPFGNQQYVLKLHLMPVQVHVA